MLAKIYRAHPDFVPTCRFHRTIGSMPTLLVYEMNKLPGDNYLNLSLSIPDNGSDLQLNTVRSLAKFFAKSWHNRQHPEQSTISAFTEECYSSFNYLSNNLPARFHQTIAWVRDNLPGLFSGTYPLVITHGDLSEMNILANPDTGEITGVIDWAEASILPFGFALYALDSILGYLSMDGWVAYDNAEHLRSEFWKTFEELMGGLSESDMELTQLARVAGLLLRYGIPYRSGRKGVVGIGVSQNSVKVLDTLVFEMKGLLRTSGFR